jgi:hypothetical protein
MRQMLKDIKIAEPVFLRNLQVYPLHGLSSNGHRILTIEEMLENGSGDFQELDEPKIDLISYNNKSDDPVLLLDGEEIIGALQNRIVAASTYIEAHTASDIDVICAEEGRWKELGGFTTGYCSYPGIRAILSVHGKKGNGLQKTVWQEIDRKLTVTKTLSATSSMHDIYNSLQDEVSRYVEDFHGLNHDTVGFVGVAGREILGCDLFSNTSSYRKFENKLIRSYALDAIEQRRAGGISCDVQTFLEDIEKTLASKSRPSRGHHFKLKSAVLSGQGIYLKSNIIHLSAFPK